MLFHRVITAVILIPLVVWAVFKMPVDYFSLVFALLMLVGAWEWANLIQLNSIIKRILFLIVLMLPMLFVQFWTQILEIAAQTTEKHTIRDYSGLIEWLVVPPVLFWLLMMILIRKVPEHMLSLQLKPFQKVFLGIFLLNAAWMCFTRLKILHGAEMTLYFLILIWSADIAAYFVGKKYGKTKLAPEISPGKTIAGMYGALASAVICAIALGLIFQFNIIFIMDFILLSVLTVLISIYGDLFFSLAKRQRGVKDSGVLFPGHGGVLDRLDSLIAAAPFFYAGLYLIYRTIE